jgi:hypothetical protein
VVAADQGPALAYLDGYRVSQRLPEYSLCEKAVMLPARNRAAHSASGAGMLRRHRLLVWVVAAFLCNPCAAQPLNSVQPGLAADAYIASIGGTLAPAGSLEIDGRLMTCGRYPTVLDPDYRDFGGAHPGFLVLNPRLFGGLATPVKLWIFSHECAHQSVGTDEVKADCAAVQRGRREGWLTESGLEQVCEFMRPARQDQQHFNGVQRCELMRKCFAQGLQKQKTDHTTKQP